MRSLLYSFLVGLFLTSVFAIPLFATGRSKTEGEWIVTRQAARRAAPWDAVIQNLPPSYRWVKTFGPDDRYALVKGPQRPTALTSKFSDEIVQVQPNFVYSTLDGNDPDFEKSWGLKNTGQADNHGNLGKSGVDIGAEGAWELSTGSAGVVVAIVDTGIDLNHEDLKANLWVNRGEIPNNQKDDDGNGFIDDVNGWNFVDNNNVVQDAFGHGTFCAGIIGAQAGNGKGSRGVDWKVSLMAVKAQDAGGLGTTASAVSAIQYAVKNGAAVINASWGQSQYDPALYDMVKWAGTQGVLVVAAAGNDAQNNDTASSPTFPASFRLSNLISVAAYDPLDRLADFSNFGPQTVQIGAPGVGIYSTVPGGYEYGDGTSYAAPFVTGVAALLKAYAPSLSLAEWRDRLLNTSRVIDYYQKEKTKTAGFVSAYNALKDIRPLRPTPPTQWTQMNQTAETSHPYANNSNLTFRFVSAGATHIRAHFSSFDTETDCDIVTLTDGRGKKVQSYSGSLGDFISADALGDTLVVKFTSDSVTTGPGFVIDYVEVSSDTSREKVPSYFSAEK